MSATDPREIAEHRLNAAMVRLRSRYPDVYRTVQQEADPFGPLAAVLEEPSIDEAAWEMLSQDREEAEGRALAAEGVLEEIERIAVGCWNTAPDEGYDAILRLIRRDDEVLGWPETPAFRNEGPT